MDNTTTLTKYERVRVIGERAKQIEDGAPPTVDITGLDCTIKIATKEFEHRTIPFIVVRPLPDGSTQRIRISELES